MISSLTRTSLLIQVEDHSIPSTILNPPNRPFRKRCTSQLSISPTSPSKRSSKLTLDLKYLDAIKNLMISPQERTYEEVQFLVQLTAPMPYFQDMNRKSINQSERVHERCCAVLRYEFFHKGDVVFNADEKPNKFYIIFSGSVNILIPKTETLYKREHSRKGALKITKNLVERYTKQIKKTKNGEESESDKENPEEKENEINAMSPTKLRGELLKYTELLGGVVLTDLNSNSVEDIFVDGTLKFTYYSNLKEGYCFGELGLLRGKTRSATVVCKEDCHFAVMMAEDYKTIVAVIERKKMYNKFEFFKNFLVKGIAYDNLAKLAYSFEKKKFGRNEYVFKEGDPGNEVFLIKKGDVQIHKILIERSQKNKKLMANKVEYTGRKIPLLETFNKKNQIVMEFYKNQFEFNKSLKKLITLLEGEFFGEDEIVNNNNPNDNYQLRTYSAIVSSPKASIYVSTVQFFKKYIFERPNLLKKLREKYYIKKDLWEKQLSNCMSQRKDIHYKDKSQRKTHAINDLHQNSVFSVKFTEENRPKNLESSNFLVEQSTVKKSVGDLRSRISEMHHQNVFKNELSKFTKATDANEKSIQINDSNILESLEENNTVNNNNNTTISVSGKTKSNSLESHLQFINKKYDELIKGKVNKPTHCFNFQGEKDIQFQSRVNVYLKGKFRRHFNKSSSEQEMFGYQKNNVKKFNESLMKSIKLLREREKLDLNSLRHSFFEEKNQNPNDSTSRMFVKTNKQLTYLNRIDMSNPRNILETSGSAPRLIIKK